MKDRWRTPTNNTRTLSRYSSAGCYYQYGFRGERPLAIQGVQLSLFILSVYRSQERVNLLLVDDNICGGVQEWR